MRPTETSTVNPTPSAGRPAARPPVRPTARPTIRPSTVRQPRITPGPNKLMLMASGENFGVRRTLPHVSGFVIGFVVMAVVIGVRLAEMLQAFPVLFTLLKAASVGYLLLLAWKIATASAPGEADISGRPMTFLAAAFQ